MGAGPFTVGRVAPDAVIRRFPNDRNGADTRRSAFRKNGLKSTVEPTGIAVPLTVIESVAVGAVGMMASSFCASGSAAIEVNVCRPALVGTVTLAEFPSWRKLVNSYAPKMNQRFLMSGPPTVPPVRV